MPIKGTYYNATLGPAPSSSQTSCIGCILTGTNVANDTIIPTATTKTISTLSSIPPGIWLLSFAVNCYPSTAVSTTNYQGIKYNISTTIDTFDFTLISGTEGINYSGTTTLPSLTGSKVLTITSTTTYYLNVTIAYTAGQVRTSGAILSFTATRIA